MDDGAKNGMETIYIEHFGMVYWWRSQEIRRKNGSMKKMTILDFETEAVSTHSEILSVGNDRNAQNVNDDTQCGQRKYGNEHGEQYEGNLYTEMCTMQRSTLYALSDISSPKNQTKNIISALEN